jgi:hypothetical protein
VNVYQALSIARCPAGTVTLEAGGAGTYTERAIPGSEPGLDLQSSGPLLPFPEEVEYSLSEECGGVRVVRRQ